LLGVLGQLNSWQCKGGACGDRQKKQVWKVEGKKKTGNGEDIFPRQGEWSLAKELVGGGKRGAKKNWGGADRVSKEKSRPVKRKGIALKGTVKLKKRRGGNKGRGLPFIKGLQ